MKSMKVIFKARGNYKKVNKEIKKIMKISF